MAVYANVPTIRTGLDADKGAVGPVGVEFYATDSGLIYDGTGTGWALRILSGASLAGGYARLQPSSSAQNAVVAQSATVTPLTLKGAASQSVSLFRILNSDDTPLLETNSGVLKLYAPSPTINPEFHLKGINGSWLMGMDVAAVGSNQYRDLAISKFLAYTTQGGAPSSSTAGVNDIVYISHNGANDATIGLGLTQPDSSYRVQAYPTLANLAMGTLKVFVVASQTGHAIGIGGGYEYTYIDARGTLVLQPDTFRSVLKVHFSTDTSERFTLSHYGQFDFGPGDGGAMDVSVRRGSTANPGLEVATAAGGSVILGGGTAGGTITVGGGSTYVKVVDSGANLRYQVQPGVVDLFSPAAGINPEYHLRGINGSWIVGMDVAASGANTTRDFAIAKYLAYTTQGGAPQSSASGANDIVYISHNGANDSTIGLGLTQPDESYRVQCYPTLANLAMGTMKLFVVASQTGAALAIGGSASTYTAFDAVGTLKFTPDTNRAVLTVRTSGDTNDRLSINQAGLLSFGSGSGATDTTVGRWATVAGYIQINNLQVNGVTALGGGNVGAPSDTVTVKNAAADSSIGVRTASGANVILRANNTTPFLCSLLVTGSTGLALGTNSTARITIGGTGSLTIAEASDFVLGTTTGSKIGTATTQKLAFYNATPIVQPSGTPVAATDLPTVIALANSLRTNLLALGLVA